MTKHHYNIKLDIPQDADSARYFIPEGYTASIEDGVFVLVPKENEDEKTRKELLEVIRHCYEDGGYTLCTNDYKKYSGYLENQKPADLPPGFYFIDQDGKRYYSKEFRYGDMKMEVVENEKPEWSEEDEKKIHFLSRLIEFQVKDDEYFFGEGSRMISKQEAIEMLQSLRPQPHWKPSEEQMKVFFKATPVNLMPEELLIYQSLYDDLTKLM